MRRVGHPGPSGGHVQEDAMGEGDDGRQSLGGGLEKRLALVRRGWL